jgi:rRNA biogenesis protein RRP5
MAFMLDHLGVESARRVAERAVKAVSISNDEDKFNLWVAYMNLENNFGTQQTLQSVVKRALEVNDRQQIYLQLINIYQTAQKFQYIEDIYKQLSKKYNDSLQIWNNFIEFLF